MCILFRHEKNKISNNIKNKVHFAEEVTLKLSTKNKEYIPRESSTFGNAKHLQISKHYGK